MTRRRAGRMLVTMLGLPLVGIVAGCDQSTLRGFAAMASRAKPVVSELRADHDSRLVDGELDYGVTVSFTLTNTGERGVVKVSPWISCSEGEWSREQNLTMEAGAAMELTYFFHEPSVNASNIRYNVNTTP